MSATKRYLTDNDIAMLGTALRAASDKFAEDRQVFIDIIDNGGDESCTLEAAKRLADQFNRQIADCGALGGLLEAGVWSVEGEPEDFEEADNIARDARIAAGLDIPWNLRK